MNGTNRLINNKKIKNNKKTKTLMMLKIQIYKNGLKIQQIIKKKKNRIIIKSKIIIIFNNHLQCKNISILQHNNKIKIKLLVMVIQTFNNKQLRI